MGNIRLFVDFLNREYPACGPFQNALEMKHMDQTMIAAYEEYLVSRLALEEIKGSTVYRYLSTLKLLMKMLRENSIVSIRYFVPKALRNQGKRSNDYVETEAIKKLVESIANSSSRVKVRDMCVVLLIMELGVRTIEIVNMKLNDLKLTERQIKIHSIKSGTRTLKISKDLCDLLKRYLEIRESFGEVTTMKLFVNAFGEPISRNGIRSIFSRNNKRAFGEHRFNPKALRHTYATNALDNENDFDKVSESMGHKHRCSTEWYIHRSVQRMLKRSLPHNPLNRIISEV